MRTVWAQATRPRLSSITAPRPCIKSIAARRNAAANASRIAACDVFAFFLGPVLAAAAFADVSWKERKRKDWEKRFAEINEQLEALRAREVEVWTRIQYHSVRHGILQHKRMYSTAAAATVRERQLALSDKVNIFFEPPPQASDASWNPQPAATKLRERSRIVSETLGDLPDDSPLVRYERLLALRLALRMLLHVYTGSDDIHSGQLKGQRPDLSAEEIGRIVIRLRVVTDELNVSDRRFSSRRRKKPFRHDSPESQSAETLWLPQIQELGSLYRNGDLDIAGLVNRLSQLLLRADRKPPGPDFYARVIMLLSVNNLPELAKYAVSALQNTTYVLTNHDICMMLNHSSVTRNYKAYDWVVYNLTDNKGVLATESNLWKWVRMSGMLLPLPKDEAPAVLRALIRAALNFNDPKPAEAYAKLPSLTRSSSTMGYAIKAFLQYYAKAADWTNGRRWLQEAQKWLGTRQEPGDPALRAVFVRVFDFLAAFAMDREFHRLLDAVVNAGIEPPTIDQRARESSERIWRVVERWREQINKKQPTVSRNLSAVRLAMRDIVEKLPGSDASPLHLREKLTTPAAQVVPGLKAVVGVDGKIADTAGLDVPNADTTPSSEVHPAPSVARRSEPESPSDDDGPSRESLVTRADIDEVPEVNGVQRQESARTHAQQQRVIEEQGQKLDELQNSMAALKALVELNIKAGQAVDTTQHRQTQRLQDQETKIQALEDEVRSLRDQQELQATRTVAPPAYQEDDPITEQLRFYLTQAFSDPYDLTVSQVVSWAETASNVRCPKISKADAPNSQRRPMLLFIFNNVQSGRISVDTLKAEAEAAQVRAERLLVEQEESRQARITAAETPAQMPPTPAPSRRPEVANNPLFDSVGWNIGGLPGDSTGSAKKRSYSTVSSRSQRPEDKFQKRSAKAASPISGTGSPSVMPESINCSRQQRRCFSSGYQPQSQSRPVRRPESSREISVHAGPMAAAGDIPRLSRPAQRRKELVPEAQRSGKGTIREKPRPQSSPSQPRAEAMEPNIDKVSLNFEEHFSLTKVQFRGKKLPIRKQVLTWQLYRRVPIDDPPPPPPATHDFSPTQLTPTRPVIPRPVPTNNPIPLVHRVFAPPPRRTVTASPPRRQRQSRPRTRNYVKARPLRLRMKYPTCNPRENETFQSALHLRYVHAGEGEDLVNGGAGRGGAAGVDALGAWDSGVR